ncbi:ferredoxin [Violaceomyces palustris]|uniref:Ferredoxin n=1 Tax=Violaceomyces palustris TaxID=1673888 RepID=A0ACD0P616_9BASI|nr:ferredoxin [Violaceomyces palustris]
MLASTSTTRLLAKVPAQAIRSQTYLAPRHLVNMSSSSLTWLKASPLSTLSNKLATTSINPMLRRCKAPFNFSSSISISKLHSSAPSNHGGIERPEPGTGVKITFRDSKGQDIRTVEVNEGDDLLSIAHEYDVDLEGACEGSIACSTCHVILEPDVYDKLEEPSDDENDMLDLAFGLTDTSRLGCQVKVTKELDGMVAQLPSATRNMYVDGE